MAIFALGFISMWLIAGLIVVGGDTFDWNTGLIVTDIKWGSLLIAFPYVVVFFGPMWLLRKIRRRLKKTKNELT